MEIPWILDKVSIFLVRGSMPIKSKSMLSGHRCRMPHLTEIGSER